MLTSRDIVFPGPMQVEVVEREVPSPGPGEVLCRARKSLISRGTETFCLRGEYDPGTYWEEFIRYPMSPGYSMVAAVEDVGDGVDTLKPGDRVASLDTHRELFASPVRSLYPVPDHISDEIATFASLARTTQLAVRRAELVFGESVAVIGLGILGQLVIQYLRIGGARRIIGIDTSARRCELAIQSGATHAFVLPADKARDEIARVTDGEMLDVVFEVTGHPAVLAPASTLLRRLGRIVLLGDSPTPSQQHLGPRIVGDSLSILGVHGYLIPEHATTRDPWTAAAMTALFFDLVRQGRMDLSHLIDRNVSPLDAPAVYAGLLDGKDEAIGILFDWTSLRH
jgi:threonine dehydrogenase-like Zn-dependent dehydrogenase